MDPASNMVEDQPAVYSTLLWNTRYFFVVHSTFVTFVYTHTSSVPTLKVHYCTTYILRHYCTALQHDSCTLCLYLKTVYILGEQHTVHTRLTVTPLGWKYKCTQPYCSYNTVYNGVLVHYIYVVFRYKTQVPCTLHYLLTLLSQYLFVTASFAYS